MLLAWPIATASADTRLPKSTSPDGRVALYYAPLPPADGPHSFEFYLRDPQTQMPLSDQLVPDARVSNSLTVANHDSELLFEEIGDDAERALAGSQRDRAFSYSVVWSSDSHRVAIEGGAHKFWHLMAFHRIGNSFQNENLPAYGAFVDYYRAHKVHLRVSRIDAERRLQRSSGGFPDDRSYVCWLSDTDMAVSTYPYLFKEDDFPDKFGDKSRESFFILDFKRETTPAIRGFCW